MGKKMSKSKDCAVISFRTLEKRIKDSNLRDLDFDVPSLNALDIEMSDLEKEVLAYKGPLYTKKYYRLEGRCSSLDLKLDIFDFCGREDLRVKRKAELARIDHLLKEICASNPLTQMKNDLLKKCDDVTEKIKSNKKLKLDVKSFFLSVIDKTREFTEQGNITVMFIQDRMNFLDVILEELNQ